MNQEATPAENANEFKERLGKFMKDRLLNRCKSINGEDYHGWNPLPNTF